jgi:hypothetical protein
MEPVEIRAFETILLEQAARRPKLAVLEWGSGGSTAHFTEVLRAHGVAYEWLAIEYNRAWHGIVSERTRDDPRTRVVLFDVGNDKLKQRHTPMDEYIAYPASLGGTFDIVVVDGRKRRRCLLAATDLLTEGGLAILHDAQRPYYQCAFDAYTAGGFIDMQVWVGTMAKQLPEWVLTA